MEKVKQEELSKFQLSPDLNMDDQAHKKTNLRKQTKRPIGYAVNE